MRLFVGIKIDSGLEEKIVELQKKFQEFSKSSAIKFVELGNFHLTLKFLGEIEEGRNISNRLKRDEVDFRPIGKEINFHLHLDSVQDRFQPSDNSVNEISERIKSACETFKQFKISIEGLSFFTPPKFVKVIFLEIKKGREEIIEIEKKLNGLLKNIREEDFDLHPHLTIARVGFVKEKEKILERIKSMQNVVIGEMLVKEIILYRSTLTGKGPVYTGLKGFQLRE